MRGGKKDYWKEWEEKRQTLEAQLQQLEEQLQKAEALEREFGKGELAEEIKSITHDLAAKERQLEAHILKSIPY